MYFVYSFLMGLAALLSAPYWIIKGLRHGKYLSNLGERLGFSIPELEKLSAQRPGAIWIHAVSVGETLSGVTLAKRLRDASTPDSHHFHHHHDRSRVGKERIPFADAIIYFRSIGFLCQQISRRHQPAIVIILETEIWLTFFTKPNKRACFLLERSHFGQVLRSVSALSWCVWFLSEALPCLRAFQRLRLPHANRAGRGAYPRSWRTSRSRRCQRKSQVRHGIARAHAARLLVS